MKKVLLGLLTIGSLTASAQNCTKVFISKYMRGKGNTKCIELYNPTASPVNITGFTVSRYKSASSGLISTYTPGGFPSTTTGDTAHLTGTIPAYGTFLFVNGQKAATSTPTSPACDINLQAKANQLDRNYGSNNSSQGQPMYFKGSDALVLQDASGTIVDIFGETGVTVKTGWSTLAPYRGQAGQGKWITTGYLMVRRPSITGGVLAMPIEFNPLAEYDTIPGLLAGATANDSLLLYDVFGTHDCMCNPVAVKTVNTDNASIAPNPATSMVSVTANTTIAQVTVYNVIGKVVKTLAGNATAKVAVDVTNLEKGMYIVAVKTINNNTITHKIIVE